MASSIPVISREPWLGGREFASRDPERQCEVVGYVVRATMETTPAQRLRSAGIRTDWVYAPECESTNFEGSSSRHGR